MEDASDKGATIGSKTLDGFGNVTGNVRKRYMLILFMSTLETARVILRTYSEFMSNIHNSVCVFGNLKKPS